MHHHKHYHKKNSKQPPHEDVVGALIGFLVVRIVMHALFGGAWWAIIPIIATFFHMIREIINYINDKETRQNYQYSTSTDDLFGIWVAAIIVNIVMVAIFQGGWIGDLVSTILMIKAWETTIMFIWTRKQARELTPHNAPIIRVVVSEEDQPAPAASGEENPQFCPMCGQHHNREENFCAACVTA